MIDIIDILIRSIKQKIKKREEEAERKRPHVTPPAPLPPQPKPAEKKDSEKRVIIIDI